LLANLINGNESQQNQIASHPNLLTSLRTCLAEGKSDAKKPATSCIRQLAHNPKGRRAITDAGIISTLRHLCEWSGSGMSPATVTSPISIGSPVSGIGVSTTPGGRGLSPGGRNWGSSVGAGTSGSHAYPHSHSHGLGAGHWTGPTSHLLHHYPHHSLHHGHHTVPSIYQPHSAAHQHGNTMDDDKEVVHNARAALDWLERGDTYV